jgi:tetratricopeptide (TPR) repeat protein
MVASNRRLPLWAALAGLLAYAVTLSRGITLDSLPLAAKVAGWDWQPMTGQPLVWLVTLPLRCLPAGWVPTGLNLLAAVCGALTLGLLARSVELLLLERSLDTAKAWVRKLPVLLACVTCGLELSFWQEATAATGEMVDVLPLAALIWCLLEYRASRKLRWLDAAALAWGLGVAENWVMLLTLPLFVASLVWLRRLDFFKGGFPWRMALLGLVGVSLYALVPLVNGLAPHSPWNFTEAGRLSLRATWLSASALYARLWVRHSIVLVVVLAYYAIPTLSWLLPSPEEGTAYQPPAERFQMFVYRLLGVVFLLGCLWLALDPAIGPRQLVLRQTGLRLPLLSFDYLNALGAGFLAGSFVHCLQRRPERQQQRMPWESEAWQISPRLKRLGAPALAVVLAWVAAALVARNAPALAAANRLPLESFGDLAVRSLPAEGGVVLSDDPSKLAVFEAALSHASEGRRWLAVDAASLPIPEYRARLERQRPCGWLTRATRHRLSAVETRQLLCHLARTNRLYYLHPSFGVAFEAFYLQPEGAVYAMRLRAAEPAGQPAPPVVEVNQAQRFWDQAWRDELASIKATCSARQTRWWQADGALSRGLHLKAIQPRQAQLLGQWYSAALDDWAVQLQRRGHLPEARLRLEQAIALNTNNVAARVSLQCNTNLQAGIRMNLPGLGMEPARLGGVERLSLIMSSCGPSDDPALCYALGRAFQQSRLPRQATEQFERAQTLAPGALAPQFALAHSYALQRMDGKVLAAVAHLREATASLPNKVTVDMELTMLEANAWLSQTNPAPARHALESLVKRHPDDARTLSVVARAYQTLGDLTNALELVTTEVARQPDNASLLVNEAGILMEMGNPSNAVPVLDRALAITNTPALQHKRAIALAQAENYRAVSKY